MSTADALVLAYEILNGTIESKAAMSYGPSDKYPPAFWTSKLGGIKEETVKRSQYLSSQSYVCTGLITSGKHDKELSRKVTVFMKRHLLHNKIHVRCHNPHL